MGKVIVFTGASRGLGSEIARSLANKDSTLVLAARDRVGLEETAKAVRDAGGRAVVLSADVAKAQDREALIAAAEAEGPIDVLINNAAIEIPLNVTEQSPEEIERQLQVNLYAPILLTRRVLPRMIARKSGVIVMMSSMSGKSATPFNSVYAATKHGLNGFVSSVRFELEGTGVHIGAVCPGFVSGAGMWADGGVKAPALMRAVPPSRVAAAVKKVMNGAAEVLVTPGPVRPLLALSQLIPSATRPVLNALGIIDVLRERAQVIRSRRKL